MKDDIEAQANRSKKMRELFSQPLSPLLRYGTVVVTVTMAILGLLAWMVWGDRFSGM